MRLARRVDPKTRDNLAKLPRLAFAKRAEQLVKVIAHPRIDLIELMSGQGHV
jgi:hypothetical protein